jgi:hypothetical protein
MSLDFFPYYSIVYHSYLHHDASFCVHLPHDTTSYDLPYRDDPSCLYKKFIFNLL